MTQWCLSLNFELCRIGPASGVRSGMFQGPVDGIRPVADGPAQRRNRGAAFPRSVVAPWLRTHRDEIAKLDHYRELRVQPTRRGCFEATTSQGRASPVPRRALASDMSSPGL